MARQTRHIRRSKYGRPFRAGSRIKGLIPTPLNWHAVKIIVDGRAQDVEFESYSSAKSFSDFLDTEFIPARTAKKPIAPDEYVWVVFVPKRYLKKASRLFEEWKRDL